MCCRVVLPCFSYVFCGQILACASYDYFSRANGYRSQERDEELHKRDYINARQQKTLVALHGNAFIANQDQLKWFIFTKVGMMATTKAGHC